MMLRKWSGLGICVGLMLSWGKASAQPIAAPPSLPNLLLLPSVNAAQPVNPPRLEPVPAGSTPTTPLPPDVKKDADKPDDQKPTGDKADDKEGKDDKKYSKKEVEELVEKLLKKKDEEKKKKDEEKKKEDEAKKKADEEKKKADEERKKAEAKANDHGVPFCDFQLFPLAHCDCEEDDAFLQTIFDALQS